VKTDLDRRIALVTGASRGIGAAVAKALAGAGAHVVLTARSVGGLEEVDDAIREKGGTATLIPMDLLDLDAVDALGPVLADKFGKLDILIGNAGMLGTLGPITHADAKEWQKIMDLNVTANFRLIRTLDPLLRASDAGCAIFVTSNMAHANQAYWGAYATSKAALETLVKTYAAETVKTNLKVHLLNPGIVDTAMLAQSFPGGYQGNARKPEDLVPDFLELVTPDYQKQDEIIRA